MVSDGGGAGPVWSQDGRELYYASRGSMMRVSVQPGSDFPHGAPELLFDMNRYIGNASTHRMYDLAPDGRFIMVGAGGALSDSGAVERSELILVQNFFEELLRLVRN